MTPLANMADLNRTAVDVATLDLWTTSDDAEVRMIGFAERARRARIAHDPDTCPLYDACATCEQIAGDVREGWGFAR